MLRLLLAAVLALCLSLPARAQDQATLISDSIEITGDTRLIAAGNVEVYFKGRRLAASRIIYDQATDRLEIVGPIVLTEDSGKVLILASQAELAADLSEGILTSARLVLNRQLQLAANKITRVAGRTTTLETVAASSCKVCEGNPTPLWEIRASRVTHDEVARQIYFDNAQFRLAGVPVFYIPRLRMPDPTLSRATGVLMPQLRTTSSLGTGVKLPYFVVLGPSRDLTVIPYVTTKGARSLELRYRQAFRSGGIEVTGALSRDDLLTGQTRGFLQATGTFALARDFDLRFRGEAVSDPAYLLDYGLPDRDRLDSRLEITRTRRNEHFSGRLIAFNSIRAGDINSTLPSIVSDVTFHRRFSGGPFGGEAGLRFQTHSHYRSSDLALDSDGDGISDGRDVARASLRLDWRRSWIMPMGIEGTALGEVTADAYRIRQDAVFGGGSTRVHGATAVELRWPWIKAGAGGASHVIEPVVQLIWSPGGTEALPNEDSALVEFDEGNLFSLNRFPGSDATERGVRANLGIGWTRHDPAGWTLGVTVGRVIRDADLGQFSVASGLDGRKSDWLAALHLGLDAGFGLTSRFLLDDDLFATKAELRMDLTRERYGVQAGYVWAVADLAENRPDPTSELVLDASYDLTDAWTAKASGRYDFEADRATRAGLGLAFRNECLRLDLSLSRRFTSSTSVRPSTDFGLSVDLLGFGSGAEAGPAKVCRR